MFPENRKRPNAVRRSICSRNYKGDPLTQIVRMHQYNISSAILQTTQCLKREMQRGTRQIKDRIAEKPQERRRGKRIHGHFPCNVNIKLVDNEQTYQWLKFGDIKEETESTVVADQDQTLSKNYCKNKMLERRN